MLAFRKQCIVKSLLRTIQCLRLPNYSQKHILRALPLTSTHDIYFCEKNEKKISFVLVKTTDLSRWGVDVYLSPRCINLISSFIYKMINV